MKPKLLILLFLFFSVQNQAQEKNIETESILVNDLISFAVNSFNVEEEYLYNITFLIQTRADELQTETLVMLQQGFKLISERLSEDSELSLITYTHFNGVALEKTNAKELKLILNTLTDLKGNINEFSKDGMNLAYNHAETFYQEEAINLVLIIRNNEIPNTKDIAATEEDEKAKKKKKTKAIIGVALAVLPELIGAIKD